MAKILVVEDDQKTIELIEFLLKKNGYSVCIAKNGIEAIKVAEEQKPDLILMDILMPEMDGIKTTKKIKENKNLQNIPIIMISAIGQEIEVTKALQAGASDYVVKPFSPKKLLKKIETELIKKK